MSTEDFQSLMNFYAEDAAMVVRPDLVVKGKENILKAFIAIAEHFQHKLVVTQGEMKIIEGAGNALIIMETLLDIPASDGTLSQITRRATYEFRQEANGEWLCTIDNSYGTTLLDTF
ncbi:YybH family protein [Brenneria izadpanahii]|uniref:YybH family protein n=1 Tax=Brenneria izadpanahii TaxID=2722756 RepID=UPI001FE36393|nr:nuclear transport factor 2 family protein [Brenneria izadpanahii]